MVIKTFFIFYIFIRPILKLLDSLLVIGLITDEELIEVLRLIHPASFGGNNTLNDSLTLLPKGLADIELAEGVKLQLVSILEHLCDIQVLEFRFNILKIFITFITYLFKGPP